MYEKVFVNESSTCVDLCVEVFGVVERDVEVIVRSGILNFYNTSVYALYIIMF